MPLSTIAATRIACQRRPFTPPPARYSRACAHRRGAQQADARAAARAARAREKPTSVAAASSATSSAPGEQQVVAQVGEAGHDHLAEPTAADQRGERRARDDLHGARAHAREQHRRRDGQLGLDEPLHRGQPHAGGRVAHVGIDLAHTGVGGQQDRRHTERDERDHARQEPGADERVGEREQRERRDRPAEVGDAGHREGPLLAARQPRADRQADRDRQRERDDAQQHVALQLRHPGLGLAEEHAERVAEHAHQAPAPAGLRGAHGRAARSSRTSP